MKIADFFTKTRNFLNRRVAELFGLCIILLGLSLLTSIATYSPNDPNFFNNHLFDYELKKKNQELDKFKFVLDYKIRELKQQIEPRQLEINNMREKIKDMDEELAKYHKSNANLDELIGQVRTRINDLLDETKIKSF